MLGRRVAYDEVSYFFCNIPLGSPLAPSTANFLGSTREVDERISRGSLEDRSCTLFYLKNNVLRASFSMGRPASETLATELLIRHRINLRSMKGKLSEPNFALEAISTQSVLILQSGGALGAFECGVVKALEEANIRRVELLGHRHERHAMLVKQLHQLGEVGQRPGQPVDFVDDNDVHRPRPDVAQ